DEQEAVDHALGRCEEGDLLLIFGDDIGRCWRQITGFGSDGKEAPAPSERGNGAASFAAPLDAPDALPAPGALLLETPEPPRETYQLKGGRQVVRDRRGIRVVHDEEA